MKVKHIISKVCSLALAALVVWCTAVCLPRAEAAVEAAGHNLPAGTILTDNRHSLRVAVPDGYVSLLSMQMPGKRRMTAVEVLNGHKFGGTAHFE